MNNVPSVGIIGGGFVGSAIAKVFQHYTDVRLFDIDPSHRANEYHEVISQDVLFVCLPTPMLKDGRVDDSYIRNALEQISSNTPHWKPVILKSTAPPFDLVKLATEFSEVIGLVFSPEFLTERTAEYDLQQSTRFIFGSLTEVQDGICFDFIEDLFRHRFPGVARYWVSLECASLVKYFTNVFFANKVSILNEFYQVAAAYGVEPSEAISLLMLDSRIGRSHFQVPGHDGHFGYGGSCFLKDINGYQHLATDAHVDPTMAAASWRKNLEVRGVSNVQQELTRLLGRAATESITTRDLESL